MPVDDLAARHRDWLDGLHTAVEVPTVARVGQEALRKLVQRFADRRKWAGDNDTQWAAELEDCGRTFVQQCAEMVEACSGVPPSLAPKLIGYAVRLAEALWRTGPLLEAFDREIAEVSEKVVRLEELYNAIVERADAVAGDRTVLGSKAEEATAKAEEATAKAEEALKAQEELRGECRTARRAIRAAEQRATAAEKRTAEVRRELFEARRKARQMSSVNSRSKSPGRQNAANHDGFSGDGSLIDRAAEIFAARHAQFLRQPLSSPMTPGPSISAMPSQRTSTQPSVLSEHRPSTPRSFISEMVFQDTARSTQSGMMTSPVSASPVAASGHWDPQGPPGSFSLSNDGERVWEEADWRPGIVGHAAVRAAGRSNVPETATSRPRLRSATPPQHGRDAQDVREFSREWRRGDSHSLPTLLPVSEVPSEGVSLWIDSTSDECTPRASSGVTRGIGTDDSRKLARSRSGGSLTRKESSLGSRELGNENHLKSGDFREPRRNASGVLHPVPSLHRAAPFSQSAPTLAPSSTRSEGVAVQGMPLLERGMRSLQALPPSDPLHASLEAAFEHMSTLVRQAVTRQPSLSLPREAFPIDLSVSPTAELERVARGVGAWADELSLQRPLAASLRSAAAHLCTLASLSTSSTESTNGTHMTTGFPPFAAHLQPDSPWAPCVSVSPVPGLGTLKSGVPFADLGAPAWVR